MRFTFPVVTFYGDDSEDYEKETHEASLFPKETWKAPYEATLYAFDKTFELVVDQCKNGMFLCIPNKGFGCYIDTPWGCDENHHVMLEMSDMLDFEDATAISYALNELYKLVKEHQ